MRSFLLGAGEHRQETWELRFRPTPRGDCLDLLVDGELVQESCGFSVPARTEIGFSADPVL